MIGSVLSLILGLSVCTAGPETGPTSGPPVALPVHSSDVERLPPVGNAQPPADWVSKPQFHDFLLDQGLQTPALKKPDQAEPSVIEEDEEEKPIKLWEGSFTLGLDGAEG
ncbi:MAG: hypothetical protein ABSE63_06840, partial [Thermoguttaceae bacterium]